MYHLFVYLARNTQKLSRKQIETVSELKKSRTEEEMENPCCAPPVTPFFGGVTAHHVIAIYTVLSFGN